MIGNPRGKSQAFLKAKNPTNLTHPFPQVRSRIGSNPTDLGTLDHLLKAWGQTVGVDIPHTQRSQGLDERLGNQFCIKSIGAFFSNGLSLENLWKSESDCYVLYESCLKTNWTSSPRFWDDYPRCEWKLVRAFLSARPPIKKNKHLPNPWHSLTKRRWVPKRPKNHKGGIFCQKIPL